MDCPGLAAFLAVNCGSELSMFSLIHGWNVQTNGPLYLDSKSISLEYYEQAVYWRKKRLEMLSVPPFHFKFLRPLVTQQVVGRK